MYIYIYVYIYMYICVHTFIYIGLLVDVLLLRINNDDVYENKNPTKNHLPKKQEKQQNYYVKKVNTTIVQKMIIFHLYLTVKLWKP
jgi:hypothetical protein